MLAGTGFVPPSQAVAASSGQEASYSRCLAYAPDYPTSGWRFAFANWWKDATPVPGTDQFVRPTGNAMVLDGVRLSVGDQAFAVTFGGEPSTTIPDGGFVLSDPVAGFAPGPRRAFFVDTVRHVATGESRPAGRPRLGSLGEVQLHAAEPRALLSRLGSRDPGPGTGSGPLGYVYTPAFGFAAGNDGRDVVLILGDSYAEPDVGSEHGAIASASGVRGFPARGLDSTAAGTQRLPHANCAISGSRPSTCMDLGKGHWNHHHAPLAAVMALNGGAPPFTVLLSEHVNNECTFTGATRGRVQTVMSTYWAFFKATYPGIRIVQTSPVTATTSTDGSNWTTVAGQTYRSRDVDHAARPSETVGFRWTVDDWMRGRVGGEIDGYVDLKPHLCDPATRKWKPRAYAGTLTAATRPGSGTIQVDAAPTPGEALVFEPSTGNVEGGNPLPYVRSVTGSGPFTVSLTANVAAVHPAGSAVRGVPTKGDGVHPTPLMLIELGDAVICAAKASGLLRQAS